MTLWYLARAAGVAALLVFTVATVLGTLSSQRPGAPGLRPSTAVVERRFLRQYLHRAAALTGLVLAAGHVVLLVADSRSGIGVTGAVVPLTAGYRPWAVALGTTALYAFALAAVTGALRGRLAARAAAARRWRLLHATAWIGWVLSVAHGLLAGTDAGTRWLPALTVGCVAAVGLAVAGRLRGQARHLDGALARGRSSLPPTPGPVGPDRYAGSRR